MLTQISSMIQEVVRLPRPRWTAWMGALHTTTIPKHLRQPTRLRAKLSFSTAQLTSQASSTRIRSAWHRVTPPTTYASTISRSSKLSTHLVWLALTASLDSALSTRVNQWQTTQASYAHCMTRTRFATKWRHSKSTVYTSHSSHR